MDEETIRLANEALTEATPIIEPEKPETPLTNTDQELRFRSSSSSACYSRVNEELSQNLLSAIGKLSNLNYRSSRYEIAEILQQTLGNPIKEKHWLWCAQHFCPRPIIRTLKEMHYSLLLGKWTGKTPANYFTYLIKKRQPRTGFKKKEAVK